MERIEVAWTKEVILLTPWPPVWPSWEWVSLAKWEIVKDNNIIFYPDAVFPNDLRRFIKALAKAIWEEKGGRLRCISGLLAFDIIREWLPMLGQWRRVRLYNGQIIYQSSEDWYQSGYYHLPGGTFSCPPPKAKISKWRNISPPIGAEFLKADPPMINLNQHILQLYWAANREKIRKNLYTELMLQKIKELEEHN